MTNRFDAYLARVKSTALSDQTEHTSRGALENLLLSFAAEAPKNRVEVVHEPTRQRGFGAPDFKIKSNGMILGYVEVKAIGTNLDKELKSDQFKKYRTLSDNILVTDYLQWIWLDSKTGKPKARARLIEESDLEGKTLRIDPQRAAEAEKIVTAFFSEPPQGIGRSQQLALALASRSQLLRDFLSRELQRQSKAGDEGRLHALFAVFKDQVFHDLTVADFADAFAQMLAYGLFLARLNAGDNKTVTLENVRSHIPGSFRLIRELVRFLEEMNEPEYEEAKWIVDEVLSIVNGLDLASIHEDLSFRSRKAISRKVRAGNEEEHRLFERDPFIYFYEDYLKAYDADMRKGRGVYYTPPPVVNFIVRAVDDILKDKFEIADGLADHKRVTVLDFACGTGTFLLEVFERIFENIGGPQAGKADAVVREHILKNLFGFEYLIAPYTIAHLKLSQYLKDKGHELQGEERLQVFLTNTLEPIKPQKNAFLPDLAAEVEAAQKIKDRKILAIVGNPPYSGHSKNLGAWARASVAEYRKGFPELSKPAQGKWLQDDYVKFIRFAQAKMDGGEHSYTDENGIGHTVRFEGVNEGVVGVITNHSFLDNPTFKGMRKSLSESFDQIFILDLHGNAKKQEKANDGSRDENVFDIEQGVSISVFVKNSRLPKVVFHGDLRGRRIAKYQELSGSSLEADFFQQIEPQHPDWLFKPQDTLASEAYRKLWSLPQIFGVVGDPAPGIVTTQDEFAISYSKQAAVDKVHQFLESKSEQQAREQFQLCSQNQWNYERAKQELPKIKIADQAREILYRPFDIRWTIWDKNVTVHRRERAMKHIDQNNLGLIYVRQISHASQDVSAYTLVTDAPIDNRVFLSSKGVAFVSPINIDTDGRWIENISQNIRTSLDERYSHHYSPSEILGYIYAVLNAPAYRKHYAEFLRIDFPRIPLVETKAQFDELSKLGDALVNAHLLRKQKRGKLAEFHGKGDHVVEAVRYSPQEQAIHLNKTQHFAPVPEEVWNFHIGGYQVLDKYLKSRKGRQLSLNEINHIGAVADSLAFTIAQMAKIDDAYRQAFPAQAV